MTSDFGEVRSLYDCWFGPLVRPYLWPFIRLRTFIGGLNRVHQGTDDHGRRSHDKLLATRSNRTRAFRATDT